jgi:peptidoglycan/LPS O-acetylase OafA/YrhL
VVALARMAARLSGGRWWGVSRLPGSGAGEIGALDGLRAVAALSVLLYHALVTLQVHSFLFGHEVTFAWFYMESGVELFFVLSGFLLFMPYARATLRAEPLPPTKAFYRRRALRILPAYWVCLGLLVLAALPHYLSLDGAQDVAWHVVLLHDAIPAYNRAIEGPFWTLAVEAQFYLLLPLIAWAIARWVGATGSVARLAGGVLALIAAALAWRQLNGLATVWLRAVGGWPQQAMRHILELTYGSQGKYLEVFAVGMLCAVLHVATAEGRLPQFAPARLAVPLALVALAGYLTMAPLVYARRNAILAQCNLCMQPGDAESLLGTLCIGLGYGALLLAVLWGGRRLRRPFELPALRALGLISFSLYLWHEPLVNAVIPPLAAVQIPLAGALAFVAAAAAALLVAGTSYRLVERPFLTRRQRRMHGAAPEDRSLEAEPVRAHSA